MCIGIDSQWVDANRTLVDVDHAFIDVDYMGRCKLFMDRYRPYMYKRVTIVTKHCLINIAACRVYDNSSTTLSIVFTVHSICKLTIK